MALKDEESGLTDGERKLYVTLAGLGPSTVNPLVRMSGMHKSSVYLCLDRLIAKGLVSHVVKNNKRVFEAESTQKMGEFFKKKRNALESQELEIQGAVKTLLAGKIGKKQGVRIFDGFKGMETAFEDMLASMKQGDSYDIIMAAAAPEIRERFVRFIKRFHKDRAERKISARMLLSGPLYESVGKFYASHAFTKAKKMPIEYLNPTGYNICKDSIMIALWNKEPLAIVIESRDVADSFKNYFEFLWKTAK